MSDSESAESASVAASEAEGSAAWAKCRATAQEVMRTSRAAPSAGGSWICPQRVACRNDVWCRRAASLPASVRGARMVANKGRRVGWSRRQASATGGHHIQTCSAPPSPRPHSGQAPCGEVCHWRNLACARGESPRRRRCSAAVACRSGGRRSSGSSAHRSPAAQGTKQGRHQATPCCREGP